MNDSVKKLEKDWVELLCRTIDCRPLSGSEKGVADIYYSALQSIGVEPHRDAAGNIVGVIKGAGTGPSVLLNGHMDVVPEGAPEAWGDVPPFRGTVSDRKVYGRGASDMLSGLAAVFIAFREIKRYVTAKGITLPGDLIFSGVVLEEPAESAGMIELMERTLPKLDLHPDVVYIAEPSALEVRTAQRGKIELVIDVYGKVAHSSMPWTGISAVEKAQPVIDAILHNFYEEPMKHEKVGFSAMTITDINVEPGKMYSCVPDHCEITVDRRYVPPMTGEETIAQVQSLLDKLSEKDPDFKAVVHQRMNHRVCYTGYEMDVAKQHPTWITDPADPFFAKTFEALRAIGQTAVDGYSIGGTDGSISCGVYHLPTFIYSGAMEESCHQPKENTPIDPVIDCIEGYLAILSKLYGLDLNDIIRSI